MLTTFAATNCSSSKRKECSSPLTSKLSVHCGFSIPTHSAGKSASIAFRFPRRESKLPLILCREEVKDLLEAPRNLRQRTLLAVLYGSGLRASEATQLKASDIDSARQVYGSAAAKDGRIDRFYCRPNGWNRCVAIGKAGGPQAGCFTAPILAGPSLLKPGSWRAEKRGERRAFLNPCIRTCCRMPSLPIFSNRVRNAGAE
jgi:hypothetical protein